MRLLQMVRQAYPGATIRQQMLVRTGTSLGARRVDVAVRTANNKWIFFESKVNGSSYTAAQRAKDAVFRHYGIQTRVVRFRIDPRTGEFLD